jgi:hypothetical protein
VADQQSARLVLLPAGKAEIRRGNEWCELYPAEVSLLLAVMFRRAVHRDDIIEMLWPDPDVQPLNTRVAINIRLMRLRRFTRNFGFDIGALARGRGSAWFILRSCET